jgi:S-adenosylmethionine hydrolase
MQPNGIITLLTDFGLKDSYVAIMKGVILGIAPTARLIDVTHDVAPQAIGEAAYLLQTGYRYFPPGTIHLVVVDPGVGSQRRAIAVATPESIFVGPDNGVLAPVIEEVSCEFGGGVEIVELREPRFWLPDVSRTFHGRDIFAPVAAYLAKGVALCELGPRVDQVAPCVVQEPGVDYRGGLRGEIVHVDRFGNCITNIAPEHLRQHDIGEHLVVEISDQRLMGLVKTYSEAEVGRAFALIGSGERLELAIRNGNAARALGVVAGDRIRVLPDEQQELTRSGR